MRAPRDGKPARDAVAGEVGIPAAALRQDGTGKARREGAVVVHAGARDSYELALALEEAGLLTSLVTDLFWAEPESAAQRLWLRWFPSTAAMLQRRSKRGLPAGRLRLRAVEGVLMLLLDRVRAPFALRQRLTRYADKVLGRTAGRLARECGAGLVTYSYTGFPAMEAYGRPAMLFQVHPHPATVRRLLRRELELHPECAGSLEQEWELALPEEDYTTLVRETGMAVRYLAASGFTRDSLVEHGVAPEAIAVVPYGIDLERFHPVARELPAEGARLELLFVGRINQRKGIRYLLEALERLGDAPVHLTVCGRVVDDLAIFRPFANRVTIRPSVSEAELVEAYQRADLFVFPSVAEGFAQVLLEALACGLPVLSTTSTAAPDLMEDGVEGFIVAPGEVMPLVERIGWAMAHRGELYAMRAAARRRAEQFPWSRFRERAAKAVSEYLEAFAGAEALSATTDRVTTLRE